MAKGRLVVRSLSTSRKFAALHREAPKLAEFAQVLYMLLIVHSDDHGREAADPFTVKHAVVPTSPRKERAVEGALAALHNVGLISWYEVDGRKLLQIRVLHRFEYSDLSASSEEACRHRLRAGGLEKVNRVRRQGLQSGTPTGA